MHITYLKDKWTRWTSVLETQASRHRFCGQQSGQAWAYTFLAGRSRNKCDYYPTGTGATFWKKVNADLKQVCDNGLVIKEMQCWTLPIAFSILLFRYIGRPTYHMRCDGGTTELSPLHDVPEIPRTSTRRTMSIVISAYRNRPSLQKAAVIELLIVCCLELKLNENSTLEVNQNREGLRETISQLSLWVY